MKLDIETAHQALEELRKGFPDLHIRMMYNMNRKWRCTIWLHESNASAETLDESLPKAISIAVVEFIKSYKAIQQEKLTREK